MAGEVPTVAETRPAGDIPYRPEQERGIADYAVAMAITLLALVAMLVVVAWLHRRGALPFQRRDDTTRRTRVIDRLPLSRATELSIVEHDGTRIAIVESPRGVAITILSATPSALDDEASG